MFHSERDLLESSSSGSRDTAVIPELRRLRRRSFAGHDDRRETLHGQAIIQRAEQRGQQVVDFELPCGDRALVEQSVSDPPRNHAGLVEIELLLVPPERVFGSVHKGANNLAKAQTDLVTVPYDGSSIQQ